METRSEATKPNKVESKVIQPEVIQQGIVQPEVIQQGVAKTHVIQPEVTQRNIKTRKIIYYILGVLETLFAFRFIFKILGANPGSAFVNVIYSISNIFLAPFKDIFRSAVTKGIETDAVLEPELLIAMATYAILIWGIIKLVELNGKQKDIKKY